MAGRTWEVDFQDFSTGDDFAAALSDIIEWRGGNSVLSGQGRRTQSSYAAAVVTEAARFGGTIRVQP